jgi:hypothetical protein
MENDKRIRGWCFTLNNWTDDEVESVKGLECVYLIFGKEIGEETHTPHLQGYVYLKDGKTMKAVSKLLPRARLSATKGTPDQNEVYCSKDGDVFEKGVKPLSNKEKGENERERCKRNLDALIDGRLDEVDVDIIAKQLKNYQYGANAIRDFRNKPVDLEGVACAHFEWHTGVHGSGKTEFTTKVDPKPFIWTPDSGWNDYNYQESVVMQDIDSSACPSVHQIKLWCDLAAFQARILYGTKHIRPKKISVTSNETIEECYARWPKHVPAIARRFTVHEWTEHYYVDADEKAGVLNPDWTPPSTLVIPEDPTPTDEQICETGI